MIRLDNANAIVVQGLIAPKGLDCLKALNSWKFENKPPRGFWMKNQQKTLSLRAPLVAIGAQKKVNQTSEVHFGLSHLELTSFLLLPA